MLGGGNPTGGSNPAGLSKSINYIGKLCYAYSGIIDTNNNDTTFLDTTTGAETLQVIIDFGRNDVDGAECEFIVSINSEDTFGIALGQGSSVIGNYNNQLNLIIAPFSRVIIKGKNLVNSNVLKMSTALTGEIL